MDADMKSGWRGMRGHLYHLDKTIKIHAIIFPFQMLFLCKYKNTK